MRARGIALAIILLSSGGTALAEGNIKPRCAHPAPHYVEDSRQAILSARSIWHCARPDIPLRGEDVWLKEYVAELRGNVWHISQLVPQGYAGGGIVIDVRQIDGSLVGVYLTQ